MPAKDPTRSREVAGTIFVCRRLNLVPRIGEFGFKFPASLRRDGEVVDGHLRFDECVLTLSLTERNAVCNTIVTLRAWSAFRLHPTSGSAITLEVGYETNQSVC
jgi:hypothetical protein